MPAGYPEIVSFFGLFCQFALKQIVKYWELVEAIIGLTRFEG